MLKWSTDYFMAAHKSGGHGMFCSCQNCDIFPSEIIYFVPSDCEFVGQIGNGGVDHGFWGRPEEMTMDRFDDEDSDDDDDDGDVDGDNDGDVDDIIMMIKARRSAGTTPWFQPLLPAIASTELGNNISVR